MAPDDIVNPVNKPGDVVKPIQKQIKWWEWEPKQADMVACYGAGKGLKRFWVGQQGEVRAIAGELITVKFIPTVASDLSEVTFHKKQLRPLKQAGGRTLWIRREDLQKVKAAEDVIFSAAVSYRPKEEPSWVRCEQKTIEWEEQ